MIPIVLIALTLAGVLLWALYSEPVPPRARPRPRRLDLPLTGADIRRHNAPIVLAGYDPRWVDAHLKQVAAIHEGLNRGTIRDTAVEQSLGGTVDQPGSVLDG